MQMIRDNQFDGRIRSDPHRHIDDFLQISSLFQYGGNQNEAVMLTTFPFLLSGESKTWLNELNEGTITSWNEMREAFISQYFYLAKFKHLLNDIHSFHQLGNETLVKAWLRLKEMLRICYGHGLTKGTIKKIKILMEKFELPPHSPPVIIIDPDDQPMWSSTRNIAPTPTSAIIQRPISTNFHVKGTYMQMIRDNQFDGRIRSDPHRHIDDFLEISSLFQYGGNQEAAVMLRTFPFLLSEESKTWLNEINEGTITSWNEMREAFISQ
nr:reverse transcriptase domain-containing protein [Tanacetum cinerariifolium]